MAPGEREGLLGEGVGVVEGHSPFLFLFGGEGGLGGRESEKHLRVGWMV